MGRKTNRGLIPIDIFKSAAEEVLEHQASVSAAAKAYSINRMTLSRYINKTKNENEKDITVGYSSHRKIMTSEMETDLAGHIIEFCNRFYGLTRDKARALAFEFASKSSLDIPSIWREEKMAGKKWLRNFMNRNKLCLRSPEATSYGRATAFNSVNVSKYLTIFMKSWKNINLVPGVFTIVMKPGFPRYKNRKKY